MHRSHSSQTYIEQTESYCAHNYHPLPVVIAKGKGSWVCDVEGNRYLDMLSAYSAVNQGHNHPRIRKAAIEQMERLPLTSRAFFNDVLGPFAEKICRLAKKDKMVPMNSGSEAVETALKIARKWGHVVKGIKDGQQEIIVCSENFHGRTIAIISMSTEQQYRDGFGPLVSGFKTVPFGDTHALEQAITSNTVAVIVEPVQGEGGIILPPEGYIRSIAQLCATNNILFIADEVQTGLGRTGKLFACDHEGVIPDMYILGKALSGGFYPVSAVLADNHIMQVLTPGDHGSTFGGNPLACAIGIAALDVIIEEQLPEKASQKGKYFLEQLRTLPWKHIKEVRGKGLLIGVEIKRESGKAMDFCYRLKEKGVLCKDTHEQTIRFAPPLTITKEEIDFALNAIRTVLTD